MLIMSAKVDPNWLSTPSDHKHVLLPTHHVMRKQQSGADKDCAFKEMSWH